MRRILIALENWKDEKLVSWFVREFRNEREEMGIHEPRLKASSYINAPLKMTDWLKMGDRELSMWEERCITSPKQYVDEVIRTFCRVLNKIVRGVITPLDSDLKYTELLTEEEKAKFKQCREQQKLDDPTGLHFNAERMGQRRELMDKALKALSRRIASESHREGVTNPETYSSERASKSARFAGMDIFKLKQLGNNFLLGFAIAGSALVIAFVLIAWSETYRNPAGEPFSISSGISAWPTEALRLAAFFFSGVFLFRGFYLVRKTILRVTREYRFAFGEQGDEKVFTKSPQFRWFTRPVSVSSRFVERDAEKIWANYQKYTSFRNTFQRSLVGIGFFLIFGFCLMYFSGFPARPIRGNILGDYDKWILGFSVAGFLTLAFWTIEICRSTQWFVEQLTDGPTVYPVPTRQHFSAERGNIHHDYLDEWIDIQLIADVTEAVGKLIYFPFVIFFLLLLARNQWWDNWGWTNGLIIIFLCNLALAAASILILQRSARQAKVEAEASLAAKVARSQAVAAPSPAANDAFQAERLLNDMRSIRRGAFVPFWENPLLAAILLPSGGTVLLELLLVFMNR